ncbi:hypothetical protein JQ596_15680 [Bradyrhizobium manausense]|uniref:hypothetical protein n=1 Tax=Bradyrhizobium manausense TaxID=989370 RepID=UPI001BA76E4E|nr:hypothetical protein [Bradyrhizobium manausense]MBR0826985.1 hypothetical protein [Bradyrhizobium manausense]
MTCNTAAAWLAALIIANATVAHAELSPEALKKASEITSARKVAREAFATPATEAAIEKARKYLDKPIPGRNCDDGSGGMLICQMEDGGEISVQAVPFKTSKEEATELCANPYAEDPKSQEIVAEMKGGDVKKTYTLLWCIYKTNAAGMEEAKRRIAADNEGTYLDKEAYSCEKEDIEEHMTSMIDKSVGHLGVKLLYVKDNIVEVSRNKNELRCRIEIKTNQFNMKGIFRYHSEDGHNLVGWEGGKSK